MKYLFLSILLAFFLALPAKAVIPYHGFFETPWNTSKQQILKITEGSLNTDGQVMVAGKSPRGVKIAVFYGFNKQDQLTNVLLMTKPPNEDDLLKFCSEKTANYDAKFGRFDRLEINIAGGPLLVWENEDTEVQMMCDFDNKVFLVLHIKKGTGAGLMSIEEKKPSKILKL